MNIQKAKRLIREVNRGEVALQELRGMKIDIEELIGTDPEGWHKVNLHCRTLNQYRLKDLKKENKNVNRHRQNRLVLATDHTLLDIQAAMIHGQKPLS